MRGVVWVFVIVDIAIECGFADVGVSCGGGAG